MQGIQLKDNTALVQDYEWPCHKETKEFSFLISLLLFQSKKVLMFLKVRRNNFKAYNNIHQKVRKEDQGLNMDFKLKFFFYLKVHK